MIMRFLIFLTIILLPDFLFGQPAQSTTQVLMWYGVLPISVFTISLILASMYANRDKLNERRTIRVFAWIFVVFNSFAGCYWLFYLLTTLFSTVFSSEEFSFSYFAFLIVFVVGGFLPLKIMLNAEKMAAS